MESINIKNLIAVAIADVDIHLLQDETQTKDLDKVFTVQEVRNQLEKTCRNLVDALIKMGYDIDKPIKK
jgi:hypothetical protein